MWNISFTLFTKLRTQAATTDFVMVLNVISIQLGTKQATNSEWKFKNKRKISSFIILSSIYLRHDSFAASRQSSVVIGTHDIPCDYQFLLHFSLSYCYRLLLHRELQVLKKDKNLPNCMVGLKDLWMDSYPPIYLLFGTEWVLYQFLLFSQITMVK